MKKQGFRGGVPPSPGARPVHAGAPPPTLSARARARNGKQNAPRTSSCSSRSRVVRFVSRFSRARGHVLSLSWAPWPRDRPNRCHFGGSGGGGMSPIFVISGVRTLAPCELSPCGPLLDKKYFLTEWRCRREDRAQKGIRMNFFLTSAAFRGHSQLTRGHPLGTAAAPKVPPGAKFDGVDGGTPPPGGGRSVHTGAPVPTLSARAHVAMCYRCRGLRGRATDRTGAILVVPGGGACPPFS